MKILSPAGNMECLKSAIMSGADEVYVGINNYNARNIDGFTIDTIKEAIDFSHLHNVKILLAINILFTDDELQEALNTAVQAYNYGIDALIVQDLGFAKLLHENYPEIELHASTQMGIHNLEGVMAILSLGFKRVVLARETSLDEIKRIKDNTSIEIEYFGHGALCVSFSGNCYLSSYLSGASGNRGKCKQFCRLPYTLLHNNKPLKTGYLLSAKDFCMIDRLSDLNCAGVDVLKIEGRARRPFYVAQTTRQYKNALSKISPDKQMLNLAFNRGFTAGYFDGNGNIISNIQNHIGIKVGKVEGFEKGKRFNVITFSSNVPISAKSTLKFLDNQKEQITLSAFDLKQAGKGLYTLSTTAKVNVGWQVNLIADFQLENKVVQQKVLKSIDIHINAHPGEQICATVNINKQFITIFGDECQPAQKMPLSNLDFEKSFSKSEYFIGKLTLDIGKVFLTKQQLNSFRRKVYSTIFEKLTQTYTRSIKPISLKKQLLPMPLQNWSIIENIDQDFDTENIIYSPNEYKINDVQMFIDKCKYLNKNAILETPNFATKKDIELLKTIINNTNICILANNYYATTLTTNFIVGAGLNIYNSYSLGYFKKPYLCAEGKNSIKFAYMTLRHCPLKCNLNASCINCPYDDNYTYKMDSGKILRLRRKKLSSCTFYLTD